MILEEKLDFNLLESFNIREFMQIYILELIFNCTYELIDFQDNNVKDVYI